MTKRLLAVSMLLAAVIFSGCASNVDRKIEVQTLVKSGQSWDGVDLPAYPTAAPEITILRITIPPKTELPLHHHPVINAGVLLKGELTVITENQETLHLKAGDALIEVVDKLHHGRNDGNTPAEIIVVYAAAKGDQITVKD
ncbi:MAG: cupin domain-containing protein [Phycisphaerae bacterium]|nr:cupin domain-containing protein [Phycisphaerae bacterium]